jgi:hypothetical protein
MFEEPLRRVRAMEEPTTGLAPASTAATQTSILGQSTGTISAGAEQQKIAAQVGPTIEDRLAALEAKIAGFEQGQQSMEASFTNASKRVGDLLAVLKDSDEFVHEWPQLKATLDMHGIRIS